MANQRKIDDHSWWAGRSKSGEVFPDGAKRKQESSAGGAGGVMDYPDTTEKVKRDQVASQDKIRSNAIKPGYRN